jgi:succinate dehydrogenase hydrophobic anchor subunit
MRVKASTIMLVVIGLGFLYLAISMENKAYDQCMEVLTHPECVKIFG